MPSQTGRRCVRCNAGPPVHIDAVLCGTCARSRAKRQYVRRSDRDDARVARALDALHDDDIPLATAILEDRIEGRSEGRSSP
jgi:Tfp pilus assembly protein PilF